MAILIGPARELLFADEEVNRAETEKSLTRHRPTPRMKRRFSLQDGLCDRGRFGAPSSLYRLLDAHIQCRHIVQKPSPEE